ncbi:GNAT family N-acetyltransferase [Rouxiella sp. Mn2063]|uniref:GNAT family N-acetyltransferase n=1 Tax=Rouxiella sp. Mn2063 TaxID=3395262 RepID=UPI003BDDB757
MDIAYALPEDIGILSLLGPETYRQHFGKLWKNEDELQQFLDNDFALEVLSKTLIDEDICWLLAHDRGEAVGYAKIDYQQIMPNSAAVGAKLSKLYLVAAGGSRGWGQRMMTRIVAEATAQKQPFVWLEVLEENERAIKFYQRNGFQVVEKTFYRSASQTTALFIMRRYI